MNFLESGTMYIGAGIKYLCTLVHGEALCQFDLFSADVEGAKPLTVETIILGLALFLFPVNFLLKQNCAMHHRMSNPHSLQVRLYAALLVGINKYLVFFPGKTLSGKL